MMKKIDNQNAYFRAKLRVERLRKFYMHAAVYVIINIGISVYKITRNLTHGESFDEAFFDSSTFILWGLWGIGLALHAFSVFGLPLILGKDWEEEKLKQFMNDDELNR